MPRAKSNSIPENLAPVMRRTMEIILRDPRPQYELEQEAGVSRTTLSNWRYKGGATVSTLEAVLNVMGYRLTVVPIGVTDEEVARQLCAPKPTRQAPVAHETRQAAADASGLPERVFG